MKVRPSIVANSSVEASVRAYEDDPTLIAVADMAKDIGVPAIVIAAEPGMNVCVPRIRSAPEP